MPSCSYWSQTGSKAALVEVQARNWHCWFCGPLSDQWPGQEQISSILTHLGEQKKLLLSQCQKEVLHSTGVMDGEGKILVLANKPRMSKRKDKDVKEKGRGCVARQVAVFLRTDNCSYDTIPGPNCTPNNAQVSPPEAKRLFQIDVSVPRRWLCFSIIFKNNHCNATELIKRIKCKYYWNLMQHRHQCDIKVFYQ